jgi:hypothetical protein
MALDMDIDCPLTTTPTACPVVLAAEIAVKFLVLPFVVVDDAQVLRMFAFSPTVGAGNPFDAVSLRIEQGQEAQNVANLCVRLKTFRAAMLVLDADYIIREERDNPLSFHYPTTLLFTIGHDGLLRIPPLHHARVPYTYR